MSEGVEPAGAVKLSGGVTTFDVPKGSGVGLAALSGGPTDGVVAVPLAGAPGCVGVWAKSVVELTMSRDSNRTFMTFMISDSKVHRLVYSEKLIWLNAGFWVPKAKNRPSKKIPPCAILRPDARIIATRILSKRS